MVPAKRIVVGFLVLFLSGCGISGRISWSMGKAGLWESSVRKYEEADQVLRLPCNREQDILDRRHAHGPQEAPLASPGGSAIRIELPNLSVSETVDDVIVHHADCLHVRVNDGRTDEAEPAAFEILAERVGFE